MNHSFPKLKIFTLFLCLLGANAAAQTGTVSGIILDEARQPLPGTSVQVVEKPTGTTAGSRGQFSLYGLEAGNYTLKISFVGYKTLTQAVTVTSNQTTDLGTITLPTDALLMDAVVVTGVYQPQAKLETSTAITTLNSRQIENRVAISRGVADLLSAVPGFRVNSDGGEGANSVAPRGLPVSAEAGFGFLQLMEDNLPVFEIPTLTFAKTDIHLRLDETIDRLEVVRGGSASVLANNAPGGIINFLSKTGGDKFAGIAKFTYGDQGLFRGDLNIGGPIGVRWRYNVGGFYRQDDGLKPTGFPVNKGGNVKANLTYRFGLSGKNYLRFYGKYLNDKIAYLTGIPFQNLASPQEVPGGPSFLTGTVYSDRFENVAIPDAFNGGKTQQVNSLSNGQWSRYKSVGAELYLDLPNGFTLTNSLRYLDANLSTDGIYDLQAPFPGYGLTLSYFNPSNAMAGYGPLGANGFQFSYADTGELIPSEKFTSFSNPSAQLNGNGLINIAGWFPDQKPSKNFINSLKLTKTLGSHALSAGAYVSIYNIKEKLNYNLIIQEVANNPRRLDLKITTRAASLLRGAPVSVTQNGFLFYGYNGNTFFYNNNQDTQIASFFLADEWKATDKLRVDVGVRLETNHSKGRGEKADRLANPDARFSPVLGAAGANGGVDGDYLTVYDNAFWKGSGQYRTWDYTFTNLNVSVGANYKLTDRAAIYARYSNSGTTPGPDTYFFGSYDTNDQLITAPKSQRITQAEIGQKLAFQKFSLFLTEFYSQNDNIPFTIQTAGPNNTFILTQRIGKVSSYGIEAEATYQVIRGLQLKAIATLQNPTFREFTFNDPNAANAEVSLKNNRLDDIPQVLLDFTADYSVKGFNIFANYRYFGEQFANKRNTLKMPAYGLLFGGASYTIPNTGLRFGVQGSNLLNEAAFNDIAARNGESIGSDLSKASTYNIIKTVLPRNLLFSVAYRF
ncbi:MAG: TonB-dependent receptor [Cytophagaceae bacterium]|nr:TonB-dependent receptor [Cytophagaceae bacterium]